MHVETDLLTGLRERAETAAIGVFAANLRDLLLAAPAGPIFFHTNKIGALEISRAPILFYFYYLIYAKISFWHK